MMPIYDDMLLSSGSGRSNDRQQPKMQGVYLAIVTNNKDPEKLGRVKLKLPIREIEQETEWARMTTFMAGKARGGLFLPEVGDEVLVAFLMGDMNQPYVIGALWNKNDKGPPADDNNNIRQIVSRMGHVITFDDKDMDGKITIKTKDGHKVEILDKSDEIKIEDKSSNHSLVINGTGTGTVTLKSSTSKLEMNGKGEIKIESTKDITIKSTMLKLEASATMDLKAAAALNIKADGIITIKGAMVKIN